jgi:hypothetical protein
MPLGLCPRRPWDAGILGNSVAFRQTPGQLILLLDPIVKCGAGYRIVNWGATDWPSSSTVTPASKIRHNYA